MSRKITEVDIDSIRTDGGTQPRERICEGTIADYIAGLDSDITFPPVDVFYDGGDYWLAHGFHRYHAHKRAKYGHISAIVHQGTKEDAQWFSYAANQDQDIVGLRRTNADKERAVLAALSHQKAAKMSDRAIAEYVGVSQPMVSQYRKRILEPLSDAPPLAASQQKKVDAVLEDLSAELLTRDQANAKIAKIDPDWASRSSNTRTVTRNGKTYDINVSKIGKSTPVKTDEEIEDDEAGESFVDDAPLRALEKAQAAERSEKPKTAMDNAREILNDIFEMSRVPLARLNYLKLQQRIVALVEAMKPL